MDLKVNGIGLNFVNNTNNFKNFNFDTDKTIFAGFINDNIQRVQDSFYYQNFSYSLKSEVDFNADNIWVETIFFALPLSRS